MRGLAFAVLAHVAAVVVASECSCARVPELETEVQELRAQMKAQQKQTSAQQAQLKAHDEQIMAQAEQMKALVARLSDTSAPRTTTVGVSSIGATTDEEAHEQGLELRRLSASGPGSSLATRGWQTHVFPEGHSCPNMAVGRPVQLLPVNNQSATTWNPHPSDLPYAANVSLSSIGKGWTTSEVQSFPNPINIVHDASCSQPPTLDLRLPTAISQLEVTGLATISQLDVTGSTTLSSLDVSGTLLVNGAAVGGDPTWLSFPVASGVSGYGVAPYYTVHAGMVFFHGCVSKSGSFAYGDLIATMPSGARPQGGWWVFPLATTENNFIPLAIDASSGNIYHRSQSANNVCFDGMFYKAQYV